MRTRRFSAGVIALPFALWLSAAHAFEPEQNISENAGPREWFSLGYQAYKNGRKDEAAEAYDHAGRKGHSGALWKLGRMYADGDGVPEKDYEAFKIFESIIRIHGDKGPGTTDAAFVSSAYTALGGYLRRGISGSPVRADPVRARQFFTYSASYYGDREAQYQLGRMLLEGEGGSANPRQAARWLKLSADKGHAGARALLGYMLVEGSVVRPETVRGLTMLTRALRDASPADREWIAKLHDEAFALSGEAERQMAEARARTEAEKPKKE